MTYLSCKSGHGNRRPVKWFDCLPWFLFPGRPPFIGCFGVCVSSSQNQKCCVTPQVHEAGERVETLCGSQLPRCLGRELCCPALHCREGS